MARLRYLEGSFIRIELVIISILTSKTNMVNFKIQLQWFNNFLWVCCFLGKNLSNFIPPVWKLYYPYCHKCPDYIFLSLKIDMSNFYIGIHTNSAEIYLEINLFFSHCYVRNSWTLIFFQWLIHNFISIQFLYLFLQS